MLITKTLALPSPATAPQRREVALWAEDMDVSVIWHGASVLELVGEVDGVGAVAFQVSRSAQRMPARGEA